MSYNENNDILLFDNEPKLKNVKKKRSNNIQEQINSQLSILQKRNNYSNYSNLEAYDADPFLLQINNIKNKLYSIKADVNYYFNEIDRRAQFECNDVLSNKKINELLQNQTFVTLNVSGEEFQVSLNTLKSKRNTLFYKQIVRGIIKPGQIVYYDRDPKHFNTILNFMKYGKVNLKMSADDKDELLNESLFYEVSYLVETLRNTQNNLFEIVSVEISKPFMFQGKKIGGTIVKELTKKLDKGFCSDKDGEIIIKFNKDINTNEISIAGFNGNSTAWFVGNGKGAKIYCSKANSRDNWKYLDEIPATYGHEISTIKLKTNENFRFLKFTSNDYFGVGYLDFKFIN